MNCPYCNKKMVRKEKLNPFCDFADPSEPWLVEKEVYVCKDCGIKKIDGQWKIPHKYRRPTFRQTRDCKALATIYDVDFEPLLARQCKRFINKMMLMMHLNDHSLGKKELHIIGENIK